MNCNDCGTALKHLFGPKWYCPNDCDKKSKVSEPQYELYLPMWTGSESPTCITVRPEQSCLFYPDSKSCDHLNLNIILVEFIVKSGNYSQKKTSLTLGAMISIKNLSLTEDLILTKK